MGLSDDLRVRIRDYAPPGMGSEFQPRFSNSDLDVFLRDALYELNRWAGTNHSITALDAAVIGSPPPDPTPTQEEIAFYHLAGLLAHIRILEADASNPDDYVKYMTQDTTVDPGDASLRIARLLKTMRADFEKKLDHWIGVEHGRWMWASDGMDATDTTEF